MTTWTRTAIAIALALGNLPAAALAADDTASNEDQMVVTASGFSQQRREAPATISVMDEKAINTRSNQNVAEALREMPGVLSGSAFLSGVHGPYKTENRSGAGHFVVAMSIAAFQPRAEFDARMERFIAELKAVPCAEGTEEIFYPGEIEARNDTRFRREGLLLPADTLADLEKLGY